MIQVHQIPRIGWIVLIGVFLTEIMGLWSVTRAATEPLGVIMVNYTADIVADDGVCTLREAVIAANRDMPSGTMTGECIAGTIEDEIVVPSGTYTFSITGAHEDESTTGDLDVIGHVHIVGQGSVVIDAAEVDRVLQVLPGGNLTLQALTLQGGYAPDGESGNNPTAGEDGGGILSQGTLTLYSTAIQNNVAGRGGSAPIVGDFPIGGAGGGRGGGIAHISAGTLILSDSIITGNRTGTGGDGGGTFNTGANAGSGGHGGGLYVQEVNTSTLQGGSIMLSDMVISGNHAGPGGTGGFGVDNAGNGGSGGNGGGVYLQHDSVHIVATEILSNRTGEGGLTGRGGARGPSGTGGGVRVAGGVLSVKNTLVSANITAIGGGNNGGGISSSGQLLVRDSVIENNQAGPGRNGYDEAPPAESGGSGGGIYQDNGTIVLIRTTIRNNQSGKGGDAGTPFANGAGGGNGGGIYIQGGMMELQESTIIGNKAGKGGRGEYSIGGGGGGLFINSNLLMVNSTIEANYSGEGGAPWAGQGGSGGGMTIWEGGKATILQSVFARNIAVAADEAGVSISGDGGGIAVRGQLTMTNSTISGNRTSDGRNYPERSGSGGGIYGNAGSVMTLTHTTIADNLTGSVSNGTPGSGGGIFSPGTITFGHILLANNTSDGSAMDCQATINSLGYNLIEDHRDCIITGISTGNIFRQDPLLEPLSNNGGATQTYALGLNSPAWDAGNCNSAVLTDQRGYPRPIDFPEYPNVGDGCDIGAFEAQGVQVSPNLIAVAEGDIPQPYQVRLMRPPTASVTITLAITNQITVSPTYLVFDTTSWTLPQTITVQAIDDNELEDVMVVMIEHTTVSSDTFYSGTRVGVVEVEVQDNEMPVLPTPTPSPTATQTPDYIPTVTPTSTVTPSPTATTVPPTFTPMITPSSTVSATTTPQGNPHRVQYLPLIRR